MRRETMEPQSMLVAPQLRQATEELAASVLASGPFTAYAAAQARLEEDEHASALLEAVAQVEWDVRRMQAEGTMTREDIDRLRSVRALASSDPVVVEFETARRGVEAYLPTVNRLITEALGVDMAVLSRAGGC
jgi:cell fate (sporulation/competence/biofilm development) regulator YlbF (YheA/YmcA/DUF963 family)